MTERNLTAGDYETGRVIECSDCGQAFDMDNHGTNCPDCADSKQAGFGRFGAANETDQDTRRLHPKDDQFVDARETDEPDSGDQADLVTDAEDGQLNLSGDAADGNSLW